MTSPCKLLKKLPSKYFAMMIFGPQHAHYNVSGGDLMCGRLLPWHRCTCWFVQKCDEKEQVLKFETINSISCPIVCMANDICMGNMVNHDPYHHCLYFYCMNFALPFSHDNIWLWRNLFLCICRTYADLINSAPGLKWGYSFAKNVWWVVDVDVGNNK